MVGLSAKQNIKIKQIQKVVAGIKVSIYKANTTVVVHARRLVVTRAFILASRFAIQKFVVAEVAELFSRRRQKKKERKKEREAFAQF